MDPQVFMEIAMIIGSGCPSTGWVYSVIGVHNWQLGLMPKQAQEEVWGEDQDTLISSSYTPRGHGPDRRRRVSRQRTLVVLVRV